MRALIATAAAAALALGATACDSADEVRDTVEAAVDQAEEAAGDVRDQAEEVVGLAQFCAAALRTADAVDERDWDAAIDAGEDLVEHAPDEIAPQARTVLDGAKAYRDGDEQAVMSEEFQSAASEVSAYAEEHCDPRS